MACIQTTTLDAGGDFCSESELGTLYLETLSSFVIEFVFIKRKIQYPRLRLHMSG